MIWVQSAEVTCAPSKDTRVLHLSFVFIAPLLGQLLYVRHYAGHLTPILIWNPHSNRRNGDNYYTPIEQMRKLKLSSRLSQGSTVSN